MQIVGCMVKPARLATLTLLLTGMGSSSGPLAGGEALPTQTVSVAPSAAVDTSATSQPTTLVVTPLTTPGTDRIILDVPGRETPAFCWIYRPEGYGPGQRLPVIVCLHGTDDTGEQMVAFWRDRHMRIPAVIAAPQGLAKGWCSDDVPTLHAAFDYLGRCVWHDPNRVLLAGFSAGGVMTLQALYHEKVPVTAAAALANYVPPRLTPDEVRERRSVPVFYAVGMADINHELMRTGLEFLRSAGANVELYYPRIGHTLDAGVAQAALDWFFDQCEKQTDAAIEAAARASPVGPAAERLEQIVLQPSWHPAPQVKRATQALESLERPGAEMMGTAERLLAEGKVGQAVEWYRKVESMYGISRLGARGRRAIQQIEADPSLRQQAEQFVAGERAELALAEYAQAQRLVADRRVADAIELCRRIITTYDGTPAAQRAERLLTLLEGRTNQ